MEARVLDELLEAWRTNNRINLFLIDKISAAGMKCTLSKHGGRDVARQFAHLHNVRVWHLERRAKDLVEGVLARAPKRRGMKKGVFTTLGYFIAHESHHRGSILLTLKECGHKLPQNDQYAIWDWDRI
jgi:uncharacterized damage-inducible protein DinB